MLDRSRKNRKKPKQPDAWLAGTSVAADDLPKVDKNPAAVALGRLGGMKGGAARAASLSASRRKKIAKLAAAARWAKEEKVEKK